MLSRIADSLFWLNRYMERADGLIRLLYTHYSLSLDKDINRTHTWKPVLEIFTTLDKEEIMMLETHTEQALKKMLVDETNSNSLKMIINKARENARGVQDHITKEVWEQVNQIYHQLNDGSLPERLNHYQGLDTIHGFRKQAMLYTGVVDATMSRGTGWHFMNLGKYIERCLHTIAFTEKQLEIMNTYRDEAIDILQWRHLLFSLLGYELHLKTYRTVDYSYNVMHQVLLNEDFTRSVLYSLAHIDHCLRFVTDRNHDEETAGLLRSFGRLYSKVKYLDLKRVEQDELRPLLAEMKNDLLTFGRFFGQHFFSYA
jgi:uncharacterized alpha-E superfamily protein